MPHMSAYLAGVIAQSNHHLETVDCFGRNPGNIRKKHGLSLRGLSPSEAIQTFSTTPDVLIIYCRTVEDLISVQEIIQYAKEKSKTIKIVLYENIQTVNSFSLSKICKELHQDYGADICIFGEAEHRILDILSAVRNPADLNKIPSISYLNNDGKVILTEVEALPNQLDEIPLPFWNLEDIKGYWTVGYAHAPISKPYRFLPILTSRGCPYKCTFCIAPSINPTWRPRSAYSVSNEIISLYNSLGINDFHVSDLDPTVNEKRINEISSLLIKANIPVTWKIAQGTKIETIRSTKTLDNMRKSGCDFLSFSPESGSKRHLWRMNKRFDHEHALKLVSHSKKIRLSTQACFILGVPGETASDVIKTYIYIVRLVLEGVSEIAVTIFTPLPGTQLENSLSGYQHYSELNHSPAWRHDYTWLSILRYTMYIVFFGAKIVFQPSEILTHVKSIISGDFKTKMEMSIRKTFSLATEEISMLVRGRQ